MRETGSHSMNRHGLTYTGNEDRIVREMYGDRMTLQTIADELDRTYDSVKHYIDRIGLTRPAPPRGTKPADLSGTVERTCLFGGHMFHARLDADGDLMEFSCPACKSSKRYRTARDAMI